ncbi:unnamed protein product [Candidula unifasciata]|uniref:Beta-1,4-galactosyltransferase n=1 Tax=Candidula unifasciata TaxID=100452 RepID=A0A8S3ZMT8_9EUPU|nr:unnamed protein product [Candidula unifasciata]
MDRCSKFRVFNVLLVVCVANFLLYRYFSQAGMPTLSGLIFKDASLRVTPDSSANSSGSILTLSRLTNGTTPASFSHSAHNSSLGLPLCPLVPPSLNGPLATFKEASSWEQIAKENPGLQPGGRYKPPDCEARHRVAIVIPYRNREEHLKILLKNLHPMLIRQQLDYGIFVIDQALPGKFNRAMLMNIGFVEAMKRYDFQCAVFHDVDLIPENDKNIYSCPEMPRHLSAAIDKFNYRLPYSGIYGGVSAVTKAQFEKMNGFSNMFFGWGGEDDDMAARIAHAGFKITRYPMEIARYKMIKHNNDRGNEQNPQRFALLKTTAKRMATDGLNSLKYSVPVVEELPTHLRIQVLINEQDILKGKM